MYIADTKISPATPPPLSKSRPLGLYCVCLSGAVGALILETEPMIIRPPRTALIGSQNQQSLTLTSRSMMRAAAAVAAGTAAAITAAPGSLVILTLKKVVRDSLQQDSAQRTCGMALRERMGAVRMRAIKAKTRKGVGKGVSSRPPHLLCRPHHLLQIPPHLPLALVLALVLVVTVVTMMAKEVQTELVMGQVMVGLMMEGREITMQMVQGIQIAMIAAAAAAAAAVGPVK
jgi:hypothetical protein